MKAPMELFLEEKNIVATHGAPMVAILPHMLATSDNSNSKVLV